MDPPAVGGLLDSIDRTVDDEAAAAETVVLEDLEVARARWGRNSGDDRGTHVVRRAENELRGPREERVGDLERRVALADDEDLLALERLRRATGQVVVVGHELDPRCRWAPRVCHPDREDGDLAPIVAVRRPEHETAVLLPRRLPAAVVAGGNAGALRERDDRVVHLRAAREVVLAVHEFRDEGAMLRHVRDEAVPVVTVEGHRLAWDDREAPRRRVQPVEQGKAAEHPGGALVLGDERVADADPGELVGEL